MKSQKPFSKCMIPFSLGFLLVIVSIFILIMFFTMIDMFKRNIEQKYTTDLSGYVFKSDQKSLVEYMRQKGKGKEILIKNVEENGEIVRIMCKYNYSPEKLSFRFVAISDSGLYLGKGFSYSNEELWPKSPSLKIKYVLFSHNEHKRLASFSIYSKYGVRIYLGLVTMWFVLIVTGIILLRENFSNLKKSIKKLTNDSHHYLKRGFWWTISFILSIIAPVLVGIKHSEQLRSNDSSIGPTVIFVAIVVILIFSAAFINFRKSYLHSERDIVVVSYGYDILDAKVLRKDWGIRSSPISTATLTDGTEISFTLDKNEPMPEHLYIGFPDRTGAKDFLGKRILWEVKNEKANL